MRVRLQEAEAKRPRLQGPPAKQGPPPPGNASSQAAAMAGKQPEAERAGPSKPASSASEPHAPCLYSVMSQACVILERTTAAVLKVLLRMPAAMHALSLGAHWHCGGYLRCNMLKGSLVGVQGHLLLSQQLIWRPAPPQRCPSMAW